MGALEPLEPTSPKRGRPSRVPEQLSESVKELIALVENGTTTQVQRFFQKCMTQVLDDELETLATWVASEWDPDVDTDHVKSLLSSGQARRAINGVIAQMRRETVLEIRKHKRSESDDFLEDCVVE